jgi:hypothetical protein
MCSEIFESSQPLLYMRLLLRLCTLSDGPMRRVVFEAEIHPKSCEAVTDVVPSGEQ